MELSSSVILHYYLVADFKSHQSYLMFLKGSKTGWTPTRLLWSRRKHSNCDVLVERRNLIMKSIHICYAISGAFK